MANRKTHFIILGALLAAAVAVSCKKDDDETLPYLDGALSVDVQPELPIYIRANDPTEFTMTPKGASHPDGKGIGYRWRITPSEYSGSHVTKEENEDGDGSLTYCFGEYNKDTLRSVTVTCEAFADGYSSLTSSRTITIVNAGKDGSIQHAGYDFGGSSIEYDGIGYLIYEAPDGNTWMKQNLAYDGTSDSRTGAAFRDSEAMSDIFGRFYTWNDATGGEAGGNGTAVKGICPEGWHIPSDEEWTALANATMKKVYPDTWEDGALEPGSDWAADDMKISREFMAGELLDAGTPETDEDYDSDIIYGKTARSATFNTETTLWEYYTAVGDPTNRSGISAIPAGYARRSNGLWSFDGYCEYAIFWTSTEDPTNSSKAVCRVINCESQVVYREVHDKETFAASVRCIKDK